MGSAEGRITDAEARIVGLNKDLMALTKVVDGHTRHLGTLDELLQNISSTLDEKIDRKEWIKKADIKQL